MNPRIVIAGAFSGCGKTTVTIGVLKAFADRGLKVQPFKAGPDYIDPMFHTYITGRHSRNLDSWMLGEDILAHLFEKNCRDADIAVIEGVMGMYDGVGGRSSVGSTAHVAKILKAPVVLVLDAGRMSMSAAAVVKGFREFDPEAGVRGVIFNNVGGAGHYSMLKDAVEKNTGVKALGYLARNEGINIPERHLGLVTSAEIKDLREKADRIGSLAAGSIDMEALAALASDAPSLEKHTADLGINEGGIGVKVGVAFDGAFNFYYRDNLDLLAELGAELVYFSPLNDDSLPDGLDGMYIGGGYPEVWAGELMQNKSMRDAIKAAVNGGMPVYAECGGLMYMTGSIVQRSGESYEMTGILPGASVMTPSLKRFGYVEIETVEDNILSKRGDRIRGHEFHYSASTFGGSVKGCFRASRAGKIDGAVSWECGFKYRNLVAGYPHLHFWSNPDFAVNFLKSCRQFRLAGGA